MNRIKPYIYFWVTALIVAVISIFYKNGEAVIDINIHDTYFIIAAFHLAIFLSIILFIIGLLYFIHAALNIVLIQILTQIHTIITIGSILIYYIGVSIFSKTESENNISLFDDSFNFESFITLIIILSLVIQPLFIINSLISSFKHLLKKNNS